MTHQAAKALGKRIVRFAVKTNVRLRFSPSPVKKQIRPVMEYIQKFRECGVVPVVNAGVSMLGVVQGQGTIGAKQAKVLNIQFLNCTQWPGLNGFLALKVLRGEIQVGVLPEPYRVVAQPQ
jgi:hypothetical protein